MHLRQILIHESRILIKFINLLNSFRQSMYHLLEHVNETEIIKCAMLLHCQCWNCRGVGGIEPPQVFFQPPHMFQYFYPGGSSQPPTSKTPPVIESSYYYKMAEIKKIENQSAISKFFGKKRQRYVA